MNELALFSGAGGGILGGHLLGWRTVCAVEFNPYAASVLVARQNDGHLPPFPVWDDVRTFDGRPWRGIVDVVSGGFPCQDISVAGKGAGLSGERSGLWSEMARIVGEVRPRYVFVENSPALVSRGLGRVLGDLASLGFDAAWRVLSAGDVGAQHERERIWILAHANRMRQLQPQGRERDQRRRLGTRSSEAVPNANSIRLQVGNDVGGFDPAAGPGKFSRSPSNRVSATSDVADADSRIEPHGRLPKRMGRFSEPFSWDRGWPLEAEPVLGGSADGVAHRLDRIRALGNGQVPRVAAAAFTELFQHFE